MAQESGQMTPGAAIDYSHDASHPVTKTEVRSQIEQTRAQIGQTIDEIQSRLTPGHLVAEATGAVKDAGTRVSADLLGVIGAHPLPAAVAGAAAAAAVVGARTWRHRRRGFRLGETRLERPRRARGDRRVGRRGKALMLLSAGLAWLMMRNSREYLRRDPVGAP